MCIVVHRLNGKSKSKISLESKTLRETIVISNKSQVRKRMNLDEMLVCWTQPKDKRKNGDKVVLASGLTFV